MIILRGFSENATKFPARKNLLIGNGNKAIRSAKKDDKKDGKKDDKKDATETILSDLLDLARLLIWANNCAPQNPS